MGAKITGLKELNAAIKKLDKHLQKEAKKAIRKSLNAGAKEIKQTLRPLVPTMDSSTNFRQKGVLKRNISHKTKLAKNGALKGNTKVFFSDKNKSIAHKNRERVGITATGKRLVGPVKIYLNDPYFWHMVDRGTVNGVKAQHFIKRTEQIALGRALRISNQTLNEEVEKIFK